MAETKRVNGRFAPKERKPEAPPSNERPARSTGFGESRINAAPEGTFPDPLEGMELTVNGEPIPPSMRHLIPYDKTDQGMAAIEQRVEAAGGGPRVKFLRQNIEFPGGHDKDGNYTPASSMEITSDELGKKQVAYADALKEGKQPWEVEGYDAMMDARRDHERPGYRIRILSPKLIATNGRRGWEPIIKADGTPAMVGNMIVAEMSEENAQKREKYFAKLSHEQMVSAQDKVRDQAEQIASIERIQSGRKTRREGIGQGITRVRGNAENMDDADFVPSSFETPVTV